MNNPLVSVIIPCGPRHTEHVRVAAASVTGPRRSILHVASRRAGSRGAERGIIFDRHAPDVNTRLDGSNQTVTGIDVFANVILHERRHVQAVSEHAALQAAAAIMTDPIGVDDVTFDRVMLSHDIAQGRAHAVDLSAKERQVACPPEVLGAAANEVLAVNVVPSVVLREERLEGQAARGRIAQPDAQLGDLAGPLRVAVHRDHGVADGVAFRRLEVHAAAGAEVGFRWGGPRNEGL